MIEVPTEKRQSMWRVPHSFESVWSWNDGLRGSKWTRVGLPRVHVRGLSRHELSKGLLYLGNRSVSSGSMYYGYRVVEHQHSCEPLISAYGNISLPPPLSCHDRPCDLVSNLAGEEPELCASRRWHLVSMPSLVPASIHEPRSDVMDHRSPGDFDSGNIDIRIQAYRLRGLFAQHKGKYLRLGVVVLPRPWLQDYWNIFVPHY